MHAWELWDELHNHFNSQTKARSAQLRYKLWHITKGDRKINEYILRNKAIVDALVSIGNPITLQEHIVVILEGLPEEYHVLFPMIESRMDPHSVAEIEAQLLSHESHLERLKAKIVVDVFSVNLARTSNQMPNQVLPLLPLLFVTIIIISHLILPILLLKMVFEGDAVAALVIEVVE